MKRIATLRAAREPRIRFPGICQAAQKLGVDRVHLYKVLSGRRESRSLTARYEQLRRGNMIVCNGKPITAHELGKIYFRLKARGVALPLTKLGVCFTTKGTKSTKGRRA